MNYYFEMKNVDYYFKDFKALNNISIKAMPDDHIALLGPNGSGKTTLIRCLIGVYKNINGVIKVFGEKPNFNSYKDIGYLPENASVYLSLTLKNYLNLFQKLRNSEFDINYYNELLEMFKLSQYENIRLKKFSKGMLQKAKLLTILLHNPKILLLDEPTDGLDIEAKEDIIEHLNYIKKKNIVMIISTHDPYIVENICNKIIILNKGIIKYNDTIKKLINLTNGDKFYEIKLENKMNFEKIDLVKSFLNKYNINFVISNNYTDIICYTKNYDLINKVEHFFMDKKINIEAINLKQPKLSEAYKYFVKV